MRRGLQRVGAVCGISSPLVFLALYAVAMAGDPDYGFFRNYLSDLGVGEAAWAFNAAVILAGGLTYPFLLLGLRPVLDHGVLAEVGVVSGLGGATFLVLVGLFTEDYVPQHYVVSVGFFISMLGALGALSWSLHFSGSLGPLGTHVTEGAFVLGIVLLPFGFNPQTETVAVLTIVAWALVVSSLLLTQGASAPTP
jgi:hypothetical membrane protein